MKKRYVAIWFRYLRTDCVTLKQKQLSVTPFVLAAQDHGRKIIVAVNALAEANGIVCGMTVADAKALLQTIEVQEDDGSANKIISRLAHWLIRFSPRVIPDEPDGILLDATGCAHLWGGEEKYVKELQTRLMAFGFHVRLCIADTIGTAWAIARFTKAQLIVPAGENMPALLPLPPEALRLDEYTCQQLHKLGLRTIKSFIGMPRASLTRRFGEDCMRKIGYALGHEEELKTCIVTPEAWSERLPVLEPIMHLGGIEIGLQKLLEVLCKRLRTEGKGLRSAIFKGYRIDGKTVSLTIGTNKASHNETHLFKLFALKFESFAPGPGIELFTLEALKVEDAIAAQAALWNSAAGLLDDNLSELLDRLTNRFGDGHFTRYLPDEHHWPERSLRKTVSLAEKTNINWNHEKPRPLQLLADPLRIDVTAPIPDYPPMNFRLNGNLHKVTRADGPERIEQEWWLQSGEHRDYYAVEDEEGKRYWLFRSGHYNEQVKPGWYLHGYFA